MTQRSNPPALARWALGELVTRRDRELFLGDLDEEYAACLRRMTPAAARLWYWRQAIHSVVPLVRYRLAVDAEPPRIPGGSLMWHNLVDDVRYAIRLSAKNRVAAVAVIGTMMLGIGATTAVFSIVNSVLLKPLPFDGAERVVRVGMIGRQGQYIGTMSYPDVQDYKRLAHSFSDFTATAINGMILTEGDTPQFLQIAFVDEAYARVFHIVPTAGRFFNPEEFVPGAAKVVMLSNAFWRRQFGGDKNIVGRTVSIDNESKLVIGVLPPMAYMFPLPKVDMIVPLAPRPGTYEVNRGALWLVTAGKMKPGVSLQRARAEIKQVAADLATRYADSNGGLSVRTEPLHDTVVGDVRPMLALLSASVAAVLLIACVNIANVLLGQSYARSREFAVRAALGGAGARIRRQLITESMLFAAIGGGLGMALAPLLSRVLVTLYPGELPRGNEVGIDMRVLAVAVATTVLAGLFAGVPMAHRAAATNLSRDLRDGGRSGGTRAQRRIGGALIGSQVAMSLALVFAAGLLLRTFQTLSHLNLGFSARELTVFQLSASRARYKTVPEITGFFDNVRRVVRDVPAVEEVTLSAEAPVGGNLATDVFIVKERGDQGNANPQVRMASVDANLFSVLEVPVLAGRSFRSTDVAGAPRVAVINAALAKQVYPRENPVGHVVTWNLADWEIVGVVNSMRMGGPAEVAPPELYTTLAQDPRRDLYVFVKSSTQASVLVPQMRKALRGVDPSVAMLSVSTLGERVAGAIAAQRFHAALIGGLGILALLLSTLGIYGVVSQTVGRQTREIGIRMALGEQQRHVRRRVVASALGTAAAGAAIGVVLALATSRWLAAFVVGVNPRDPVMLLAAGGLLLSVAAVAAYVPARRASRVDPLIALRAD